MSLIGILFGIVLIFLIGKAILETLWGLCLAVYALFMMLIVAPALDGLALLVRGYYKLRTVAKG